MSRYYFDQHVLINGNIVQHLKRKGKKKEEDIERMPPVAGYTWKRTWLMKCDIA